VVVLVGAEDAPPTVVGHLQPSSASTRTRPLAEVAPLRGSTRAAVVAAGELSSWRMNSRAWRFITELPFLNWSSSSSTVIGHRDVVLGEVAPPHPERTLVPS
jgi:hypothetical protein